MEQLNGTITEVNALTVIPTNIFVHPNCVHEAVGGEQVCTARNISMLFTRNNVRKVKQGNTPLFALSDIVYLLEEKDSINGHKINMDAVRSIVNKKECCFEVNNGMIEGEQANKRTNNVQRTDKRTARVQSELRELRTNLVNEQEKNERLNNMLSNAVSELTDVRNKLEKQERTNERLTNELAITKKFTDPKKARKIDEELRELRETYLMQNNKITQQQDSLKKAEAEMRRLTKLKEELSEAVAAKDNEITDLKLHNRSHKKGWLIRMFQSDLFEMVLLLLLVGNSFLFFVSELANESLGGNLTTIITITLCITLALSIPYVAYNKSNNRLANIALLSIVLSAEVLSAFSFFNTNEASGLVQSIEQMRVLVLMLTNASVLLFLLHKALGKSIALTREEVITILERQLDATEFERTAASFKEGLLMQIEKEDKQHSFEAYVERMAAQWRSFSLKVKKVLGFVN